ncbi:MAG: RNA polymerase sigma factor [Gammaproteobacteria bacterium]
MAEEPDDRELMLRYREGDGAAFAQLYERHKGPLYRYFLRQSPDAQTAADLFQEAWTKIIASRRRYQPSARFNTYMYKLAHNCLVDHWRKLGRTPAADASLRDDPEQTTGLADTEAAVEQAQQTERFTRALGGLPEEQRSAFLLHEEGGLSLADIATVTGVPEETAKSRLRYAVKKLRGALNEGTKP